MMSLGGAFFCLWCSLLKMARCPAAACCDETQKVLNETGQSWRPEGATPMCKQIDCEGSSARHPRWSTLPLKAVFLTKEVQERGKSFNNNSFPCAKNVRFCNFAETRKRPICILCQGTSFNTRAKIWIAPPVPIMAEDGERTCCMVLSCSVQASRHARTLPARAAAVPQQRVHPASNSDLRNRMRLRSLQRRMPGPQKVIRVPSVGSLWHVARLPALSRCPRPRALPNRTATTGPIKSCTTMLVKSGE